MSETSVEVVTPLDVESDSCEEILTPFDVETEFRIPRSSQKKGRANGSFAPYFRVGRRVY